jgi:prepilin-type N-terminal cleavage/methylation domain-containing protein
MFRDIRNERTNNRKEREHKMKLQTSKSNHKGFTLIEMIGVLAVIAILAAVLIPKVFEAINSARINNASMTCDTVKTAIADHYAKWGGLNIDGSSGAAVPMAVPNLAYDQMLLKEQFLDKLFVTKIGDGVSAAANTHIEIQPIITPAGVVAADATSGYNLSGASVGGLDEQVGTYVVQAVITGVTEADAQALSQRIDGTGLSSAIGQDDLKGRVKYKSQATTTVYIYLTHR